MSYVQMFFTGSEFVGSPGPGQLESTTTNTAPLLGSFVMSVAHAPVPSLVHVDEPGVSR